jgi:hypothetical protein
MKNSDTFSRACNAWGLGTCLVAPSSDYANVMAEYKQHAGDWVAAVAESCTRQPMPSTYFDIIRNSAINAVADEQEGVGLVGLTEGAINAPWDMFQRMLSHPGVLTRVGNSAVEVLIDVLADGTDSVSSMLFYHRDSYGRAPHVWHPNDATRYSFARAAATIVFDFIVNHELAHQPRACCLHSQLDWRALHV